MSESFSQLELPASVVERARAGELAAFEQIYRRFEKPVYTLALRMLGDYAEATDAAQTACLQIYEGGVATGSCIALPPALSAPPSVVSVALGAVGISIFPNPTNGTLDLSFDNVLVTRG